MPYCAGGCACAWRCFNRALMGSFGNMLGYIICSCEAALAGGLGCATGMRVVMVVPVVGGAGGSGLRGGGGALGACGCACCSWSLLEPMASRLMSVVKNLLIGTPIFCIATTAFFASAGLLRLAMALAKSGFSNACFMTRSYIPVSRLPVRRIGRLLRRWWDSACLRQWTLG